MLNYQRVFSAQLLVVNYYDLLLLAASQFFCFLWFQ